MVQNAADGWESASEKGVLYAQREMEMGDLRSGLLSCLRCLGCRGLAPKACAGPSEAVKLYAWLEPCSHSV